MQDHVARRGDGGPKTAPRTPEETALPPLEALARHLDEAVAIVDRDGYVRAVLAGDRSALGVSRVGARIFDLVHPDDRAEMERIIDEALSTPEGWECAAWVRMCAAGGRWPLHEVHAVDRLDDRVNPGIVVRLREVPAPPVEYADPHPETAGVEREGVPRHELEALASAVPLPILLVDPQGAAYFVNHAARDLCLHLLGRLRAEGLAGIVDERDRVFVEDALCSLVETAGERTGTLRLRPLRPGAEERIVEATFSALEGSGEVHAIVVTLVDVTAHHARASELMRMASCDPLTGLHNRAEVEEALADRLRRSPERVGLLYCDLDGFKSVNDTYGHDVGDELLVEIAHTLEAKTRPGDLVGRLGGDEFVVLVDSADPDDVYGLACRIAVAIAELSSYRRLPVSASVGAATARHGDTTRELIRRADTAMYDEKRRRRRPEPAV